MDKWVKILKVYLSHELNHYDGKTVDGIKLDRSSIIAGAHLIGAGAMKKWLKSNGTKVFRDGNNTDVKEYLLLFSGYQI